MSHRAIFQNFPPVVTAGCGPDFRQIAFTSLIVEIKVTVIRERSSVPHCRILVLAVLTLKVPALNMEICLWVAISGKGCLLLQSREKWIFGLLKRVFGRWNALSSLSPGKSNSRREGKSH